MGFRDIEIFRAVVIAGSTIKAANMLGISQPAVSQAIRKLEGSSGLQLFVRARGRLIPTREATALMVDVDKFYMGFEAIEHRIKSLRVSGINRLVVAAHPALGNSFMPRALAAFEPGKKDIQVSLKILSSREVHQEVAAGQCDFGLMADEMPVAGLEHSPFVDTLGCVVMHAAHPLARRALIHPADLADIDFIALNPEDSSRHRLEAAMAAAGVKLKVRIETPYAHTVCELALLGQGVGVVAPTTVCDFLDRGLVVKPLSVDVRFSSILIFRPGKPLQENAKQFISAMRIQLNKDLKKSQSRIKAILAP
ncbi:LysR substrate-binding domain-containing protein [Pseudomonas sp. SDO528_S397]